MHLKLGISPRVIYFVCWYTLDTIPSCVVIFNK